MKKFINKVRYTTSMSYQRIFGLLLFVLLLVPQGVGAVHISLDTEKDEQNHLDTFYVPVRIDTQGECVNAVKVVLAYNPDNLSIRDVFTGDSVITLWTQKPTVERIDGLEVGRVVFEGGMPGGYCGRVSGDPGLTNILVKLAVTGVAGSVEYDQVLETQIVVEPSTKAYLHDGLGNEAELTVLGLELSITHSTTTGNNIWLSDVQSDTIAPQDFEVTLVEGPSAGNQRHYIVFNTTDKQSGVDHYEVLETDPDQFGFLSWLPKEAHWVVAESPFILRDQKLLSKIMVKAVDKNGNERISVYTPPISTFARLSEPNIFLPVLGVLFIITLSIVFIVRRRRNKKKQEQPEQEYEVYE